MVKVSKGLIFADKRLIESKKRLAFIEAKVYAHEKLIAGGDDTYFIKNKEWENN